jgi:hypothetical protein
MADRFYRGPPANRKRLYADFSAAAARWQSERLRPAAWSATIAMTFVKQWATFVACALALSCSRRAELSRAIPSALKQLPTPTSAAVSPEQIRAAQAADDGSRSCIERVKALGGNAEFTALPASDSARRRGELLARARAEPVLFRAAPLAAEPLSPVAAQWRKSLQSGASWGSFETMVRKFAKEPAVLRQIVLTDGYLYAEDPGLAVLYANYLTLGTLFREPVLKMERGSERWQLVRAKNGYEFADGPERGKPARLLLFDRVWADGQDASPSLTLSVRPLAEELGSQEIAIESVQGFGAAARLRYGAQWVPAVLEIRDGRVHLGCEAVPSALRERVENARELSRRVRRAVEPLRAAIREQVDEALPFDEPKTEDGQQDGKLRPEWRMAYRHGRTQYEFNGDRYWVFDRDGRPHVPQVCIDFIADTFERASGTWWRARGEARERVVGRLDFDTFALENKRSVEQFVAFASEHPQWFEVHTPAEEERVALRNRARFFGTLYERRAHYQPGDIVVIYGLRDDDKLHYHSFFVYEVDPLTAMPTLVAANAGRPRIRTWEGEMQNAPARSIHARIRPRLSWLEAIAGPASMAAKDAPKPPPG